jgi:hypothetical protein
MATAPVRSARHQWQNELVLGKKETLPVSLIVSSERAQAANKLAAHKRARGARQPQQQPARRCGCTRPCIGSSHGRRRRGAPSLVGLACQRAHQAAAATVAVVLVVLEAGRVASNFLYLPPTIAIGPGLSAYSVDPASPTTPAKLLRARRSFRLGLFPLLSRRRWPILFRQPRQIGPRVATPLHGRRQTS